MPSESRSRRCDSEALEFAIRITGGAMRKLAITVVVAGMIGSAAAQRTGPLPTITAQVEVHVVNVDVSVTDANGNPIPGLSKDDFEILEDGHPQKVTNFSVIRNAGRGGLPSVTAA